MVTVIYFFIFSLEHPEIVEVLFGFVECQPLFKFLFDVARVSSNFQLEINKNVRVYGIIYVLF